MKIFRRVLAALLLTSCVQVVSAADTFVVDDVRLEGLSQVSSATVFRHLPIKSGDSVNSTDLADALRSLFESGYFDDLEVYRDGQDLVVKVKERPAIALIRLEGNKVIKDEPLRMGLEQAGLKEGDIFKRATLDQINQDLLKLYTAQGRYAAKVETRVEDLPGNRVAVDIVISEGPVSLINHINIIGNEVFDDETLLERFQSQLPSLWAFFSDDGMYAREKLSADLETLRDYYMDRGYINFKVLSSQVSMGPVDKDIYITINVSEGEQFKVNDVQVIGELSGLDEALQSAVTLKVGDVFSRKQMIADKEAITNRLGDEGYLFANVSPQPELGEDNGVVLRYFVASGKRSYVRRINVRGNTRTSDEVIRRQLRQIEAAPASRQDIQLSKQRLERTGYFKSVTVDTALVEGTEDQVDLDYRVTEQQSGSFSATLGFSEESGMMLGLSVKQDNFLGTGKKVEFGVSNSDSTREYTFSENEPFYTVDGVSRGFKIYYREQDFDEDDVSAYETDEIGVGINFGYPINEYQRLNFGTTVENILVKTADQTPQEITDFIAIEGDEYLNFVFEGSWSDNHLNKGIFPTQGYSNKISLETAVPGSDLSYYRANYTGRLYVPFDSAHRWVGSAWSRIGYGESIGSSNAFPFFKHFYAGGLRSVRGYASNTLGPRDTPTGDNDSEPFGGTLLTTGGVELIFPTSEDNQSQNMRTLLFFDAGNVFEDVDSFDAEEIRFSTGLALSWITPIGPLSFVLGKALNPDEDDETKSFQFSIGQTF